MFVKRALLLTALIPQLALAAPKFRSDTQLLVMIDKPAVTLKRLHARLGKIMNPMQANMMLMQADEIAKLLDMKKPMYVTSAGATQEPELMAYLPVKRGKDAQFKQMFLQGNPNVKTQREGAYLVFASSAAALKKPRKLKVPGKWKKLAQGFDLAALSFNNGVVHDQMLQNASKNLTAYDAAELANARAAIKAIFADEPSLVGLGLVRGGIELASYTGVNPKNEGAKCLVKAKLSTRPLIRGLPAKVGFAGALHMNTTCMDTMEKNLTALKRNHPMVAMLRAAIIKQPRVSFGYCSQDKTGYVVAPPVPEKALVAAKKDGAEMKKVGKVWQAGDAFLQPSPQGLLVSNKKTALKPLLKAAKANKPVTNGVPGYAKVRAKLPKALFGEFVLLPGALASMVPPAQAKALKKLPPVIFGTTYKGNQLQLIGFIPDELLSAAVAMQAAGAMGH